MRQGQQGPLGHVWVCGEPGAYTLVMCSREEAESANPTTRPLQLTYHAPLCSGPRPQSADFPEAGDLPHIAPKAPLEEVLPIGSNVAKE